MTQLAYPVFIKQAEKDYLVFIPDLSIYTEADNFPGAIAAARDAIGLKLMDLTDEQEMLPVASTPDEAREAARKDADETFDYSDGVLTFVDVDYEAYRNRWRNRAVKKNCTIPQWLCEKAEQEGINFSKVLQDALIQKLNIA